MSDRTEEEKFTGIFNPVFEYVQPIPVVSDLPPLTGVLCVAVFTLEGLPGTYPNGQRLRVRVYDIRLALDALAAKMHVPPEVVQILESEGFLCDGKHEKHDDDVEDLLAVSCICSHTMREHLNCDPPSPCSICTCESFAYPQGLVVT